MNLLTIIGIVIIAGILVWGVVSYVQDKRDEKMKNYVNSCNGGVHSGEQFEDGSVAE